MMQRPRIPSVSASSSVQGRHGGPAIGCRWLCRALVCGLAGGFVATASAQAAIGAPSSAPAAVTVDVDAAHDTMAVRLARVEQESQRRTARAEAAWRASGDRGDWLQLQRTRLAGEHARALVRCADEHADVATRRACERRAVQEVRVAVRAEGLDEAAADIEREPDRTALQAAVTRCTALKGTARRACTDGALARYGPR